MVCSECAQNYTARVFQRNIPTTAIGCDTIPYRIIKSWKKKIQGYFMQDNGTVRMGSILMVLLEEIDELGDEAS
jgi:hypothetical protein